MWPTSLALTTNFDMDQQFTDKIQQWLDLPDEERDYMLGALYLMQLSRNTLMYRNNIATLSLKKTREFIAYQLQKFYNFRLAQLTHEQVEQMAAEVDKIAANRNLDAIPADPEEPTESEPQQKPWKPGKRDDHDSLPDEIQALYVENLDILQQMRELHLELRHLSGLGRSKEICPDSDRYPFLKEIIALDKKYHANWEKYDNYSVDAEE